MDAPRRHEPMQRYRHTSGQVGGKLLVYSGVTQDYSKQGRRRAASVVEVFDPRKESWETAQVKGDSPTAGVGDAAHATFKEDLYMFGGRDSSFKWVNSLHRLDTKTNCWHQLAPPNTKEGSPMAKGAAGMTAFGDNLALLGGYGLPHGPIQPGSSLMKNTRFTDGRGWTNEFHIYSLKQGRYVWNLQ